MFTSGHRPGQIPHRNSDVSSQQSRPTAARPWTKVHIASSKAASIDPLASCRPPVHERHAGSPGEGPSVYPRRMRARPIKQAAIAPATEASTYGAPNMPTHCAHRKQQHQARRRKGRIPRMLGMVDQSMKKPGSLGAPGAVLILIFPNPIVWPTMSRDANRARF